jgi:hypothetical protein
MITRYYIQLGFGRGRVDLDISKTFLEMKFERLRAWHLPIAIVTLQF